jgi:hypothetical protein
MNMVNPTGFIAITLPLYFRMILSSHVTKYPALSLSAQARCSASRPLTPKHSISYALFTKLSFNSHPGNRRKKRKKELTQRREGARTQRGIIVGWILSDQLCTFLNHALLIGFIQDNGRSPRRT